MSISFPDSPRPARDSIMSPGMRPAMTKLASKWSLGVTAVFHTHRCRRRADTGQRDVVGSRTESATN